MLTDRLPVASLITRAGIGIFLALACSSIALAAPNDGGSGYNKCMQPVGDDFDNAAKQCDSLPENGTTVATSRALCKHIAIGVFLSGKAKCNGSAALEINTQVVRGSLALHAATVPGGLTVHPIGPMTGEPSGRALAISAAPFHVRAR